MNAAEPQNYLVLGLAVLLFFILGGAAGWLIAQLRRSAEQASEPAPQPSAQEPLTPALQPAPPDPDKVELARLYRDRSGGQVYLEVGGRRLASPEEVGEAQRLWLEPAAREMIRLIRPQAPAAPSTPAPTAPPQAVSFSRPPAAAPLPGTEIQKPSMNPVDALLRAVQSGKPKLEQPKSLAGQIDEVLQELLKNTRLAGQEIRLADNAALGLEVWVGARRYDGIDAVPDEEVRSLIRMAVAEWQRRSTGR